MLEETVDSCLAQKRLPDEILIGDDSSDDLTEGLVKERIIPRSPWWRHETEIAGWRGAGTFRSTIGGLF